MGGESGDGWHMMVDCPCCHGDGFLFCLDESYPDETPQRHACMHCEGSGQVPHGPISSGMRRGWHRPRFLRSERLKPHAYVPSAMHMGDCAICGHLQHSSIHGAAGLTTGPSL